MNRRKSEERKAWMILTLIIVLVLAAALFLTKDFREYLRDYEAFQKYKNYVAAQEKESVSGGEGTEVSVSENMPQTGENEPAEVTPTPPVETEPPQTGNEPQRYEVLPGSQILTDVSGNVIWQADTVAPETAELLRSYVQERNGVYAWQNSYEKTLKINELDKKILETANCAFPGVKITFIGDSVTEGLGGIQVADGRQAVSYTHLTLPTIHAV